MRALYSHSPIILVHYGIYTFLTWIKGKEHSHVFIIISQGTQNIRTPMGISKQLRITKRWVKRMINEIKTHAVPH